MPWSANSLMNERMIFVAACLTKDAPLSEACARHGISRITGYKWLKRCGANGACGLGDVSFARHTQSHTFAPDIASRLIGLRRARPTWGPRKLLARPPSASVGCSTGTKKRRKPNQETGQTERQAVTHVPGP
jgi:hypothetical protein